jgi:hypothetical protein
MTKCIPLFAAAAIALSLMGNSVAADTEKSKDENAVPAPQQQTGSPAVTQDPAMMPAEQTKEDQEYLVALKKCEGLQDAAKQKCIDEAKTKFNRM